MGKEGKPGKERQRETLLQQSPRQGPRTRSSTPISIPHISQESTTHGCWGATLLGAHKHLKSLGHLQGNPNLETTDQLLREVNKRGGKPRGQGKKDGSFSYNKSAPLEDTAKLLGMGFQESYPAVTGTHSHAREDIRDYLGEGKVPVQAVVRSEKQIPKAGEGIRDAHYITFTGLTPNGGIKGNDPASGEFQIPEYHPRNPLKINGNTYHGAIPYVLSGAPIPPKTRSFHSGGNVTFPSLPPKKDRRR